MPSSRKLSAMGTGPAAAATLIKGGEAATLKPHSPLKRNVLGELDNLLPLSPDLILSVPETPQSEIRLESSFSCKSSREVGHLERLGQLSPICRSPRSKVQNVRRIMTKDGEKTKRELDYSGSIKRLISSPQESHNAKRSRTANPPSVTGSSPKVTRPVESFHLSNIQSEGCKRGIEVVGNNDENKMSVGKRDVGMKSKMEMDSGFTLIAEQKAPEAKARQSPDAAPHDSTRTTNGHIHKPSTNGAQRGAREDETGIHKTEATRKAVTSANGGQDDRTAPEPGGGNVKPSVVSQPLLRRN